MEAEKYMEEAVGRMKGGWFEQVTCTGSINTDGWCYSHCHWVGVIMATISC